MLNAVRVRPNWQILGPVLGGLLAVTVLGVALMFEYYEPLWKATTGEPYTHIMRRNPWILPSMAFPLMGLAVWRIPFYWWGRVLLVWVVGGLGSSRATSSGRRRPDRRHIRHEKEAPARIRASASFSKRDLPSSTVAPAHKIPMHGRSVAAAGLVPAKLRFDGQLKLEQLRVKLFKFVDQISECL